MYSALTSAETRMALVGRELAELTLFIKLMKSVVSCKYESCCSTSGRRWVSMNFEISTVGQVVPLIMGRNGVLDNGPKWSIR